MILVDGIVDVKFFKMKRASTNVVIGYFVAVLPVHDISAGDMIKFSGKVLKRSHEDPVRSYQNLVKSCSDPKQDVMQNFHPGLIHYK